MEKILLISFEYPTGKAYCGGVGQIVERSRNALVALGYEVYVLISSEFTRKHPVKLLLPDDSLKNYRSLGAFLKDYGWHKFATIIHHFVNWTGELKRLKTGKGRRPRIIYHFHSILRREKDSGLRTLNHFLLRQEKMIALADRIVCPSLYEYDNFCRYFPSFIDKVSVIENTIETYSPDKRRIEEIKEKLGIRQRDVVSLCVGRLEKYKRVDLLIRAFRRVVKRVPGAQMLVIGDGAYRNELLRLVGRLKLENHVRFLGFVPRMKLLELYAKASLFVLPSRYEAFSISLVEAMASGLPVIATRVGGMTELIESAKCGFLIDDPPNECALAVPILSILENAYTSRMMGLRGRNYAFSHFSWDRTTRDLLRIYESCKAG